jgi:hypothetical protein
LHWSSPTQCRFAKALVAAINRPVAIKPGDA